MGELDGKAVAKFSWQDWWEIKVKRNEEFVEAIKRGDIDLVKDLIDEEKYNDVAADVNLPINEDYCPLHYAVESNQ